MLDPKLVRTEPQAIAAALAVKGFTLDIDKLNQLESARRELQEKAQSLQAERNAYAKSMGKA
ncbi:MAG: serine--tRNA ligase, partial [Gammaproteobacteria bacterium]